MVDTCVPAVEDTLTMRALTSEALDPTEGVEVAGLAACANEARAEIDRLNSELITLIIQMQSIGSVDCPSYPGASGTPPSKPRPNSFKTDGPSDGSDTALYAVIADELLRAADELSDLGCTLASDDAILVRHIEGLQALDRLSQTQRALAKLIRGEGPLASRLDRIAIGALAARFQAQLGLEGSLAA